MAQEMRRGYARTGESPGGGMDADTEDRTVPAGGKDHLRNTCIEKGRGGF